MLTPVHNIFILQINTYCSYALYSWLVYVL